MIAYLKGQVIGKDESYLVLENNGVGYKIFTTPKILEAEIGSTISLHTYLQVREDALNLFGFSSASELSFFELLITVSGVGPKMALSVLSAGDVDMIKEAIANQDAAIFTRISGVGKKTAERIIVELKEKMGVLSSGGGISKGSEELLSALEHLGYSSKEIKEVLPTIDHSLSPEEKLRQALKKLGR